jgi:Flp pilus assembly protein TadD
MLCRGPVRLTKGFAMHRLLVRLGALALSAAALAACASTPPGSSTGQAQGNNGATASTAPSLEDEIRTAQLLRVKGDYTGAVRALSQLMLVAPDDPRIVGEYGKVLVQQGRAPEAVNFLNRAVELQPNDWTLYSALGVAYDQSKDPAKARDAYQRALVLKPGEAAVLNNFALSRMLAGDPVQARTLMAEAAAAGSADPKIASNLAMIDGLAGPTATPLAQTKAVTATQAVAAPATDTPAPARMLPASHPPRPLVAEGTGNNAAPAATTVFMQQVPFDRLAGPVAKKPVKATPHKLAKAPPLRKLASTPPLHKLVTTPPLRKLATAPHPTTAATVKSTIPALRLANQ